MKVPPSCPVWYNLTYINHITQQTWSAPNTLTEIIVSIRGVERKDQSNVFNSINSICLKRQFMVFVLLQIHQSLTFLEFQEREDHIMALLHFSVKNCQPSRSLYSLIEVRWADLTLIGSLFSGPACCTPVVSHLNI